MKALTHITNPKGERVRVLTNTKADARVRYRVIRNGVFTGHYISVPYSLMKHEYSECNGKRLNHPSCVIQLGNHTLRLFHDVKTAEGWIPDSWLVDLSEPVEQVFEEEQVTMFCYGSTYRMLRPVDVRYDTPAISALVNT